MFRFPIKPLFAAAIALPFLLTVPGTAPAGAQVGVSISYNNFHSQLAPYGTWSRDPRWGDVWSPSHRNANFRPYSDGHWVDTREYGWLWVSNERFGDITYHYGRWVSDPRRGWLWVPGYVWGPSWVVWRSGGGDIAWFPMPPGDNYYGNGAYRGDFGNNYGYSDWYGPSFGRDQFLSLWIVVGMDHFQDRNYRNYVTPQRDYGRFMAQSRDTTSYATVNNYVVNRSVNGADLQRSTKRPVQPVSASSVIPGNRLVTQAAAGIQIDQRERQQRPLPAAVNAAPAPARAIAAPNVPAQNGRPNATGPTRTAPQNGNGAAQNGPQRNRAPAAARIAAPKVAPPNPAPTDRAQRNRGRAATETVAQPAAAAPAAAPQNQSPQDRNQRNRGPATPQAVAAPKVVAPEQKAAVRPDANTPAEGRGRGDRPANDGSGRANDPGNTKNKDAKPADRNSGRGRGQN